MFYFQGSTSTERSMALLIFIWHETTLFCVHPIMTDLLFLLSDLTCEVLYQSNLAFEPWMLSHGNTSVLSFLTTSSLRIMHATVEKHLQFMMFHYSDKFTFVSARLRTTSTAQTHNSPLHFALPHRHFIGSLFSSSPFSALVSSTSSSTTSLSR